MGSRKPTITYGQCFFCKKTFSKGGIARHLQSCPERRQAIAMERGPEERLFHIKVDDPLSPYYWLHIEIPARATLADLDHFLRRIWLECCGHLSQFTIGDTHYEDERTFEGGFEDEDEELMSSEDNEAFLSIQSNFRPPPVKRRSMKARLDEVLQVGTRFQHEYDFGSTTTLRLQVVGERVGTPPGPEKVRILARNYAPRFSCTVCGEPARHLYVFSYPLEPYCERHAREHPEREEGFLPIVNSPRVGICGYTGPYSEKYRFEEFAPEKGK